jgi:hypothetical protein
LWLGESKGFWIQTGALFASAWGAIWIVWSRGRSERRRATVDLLIEREKNYKLLKALSFVRYTPNLIAFVANRTSQQYIDCITVLNHYEFVAAGIREKALDSGLYKRMQYTMVVKDWEALCPFVMELRRAQAHTTLFQELELLAKAWEKKPLQRG